LLSETTADARDEDRFTLLGRVARFDRVHVGHQNTCLRCASALASIA
jgi:hypothetical protein